MFCDLLFLNNLGNIFNLIRECLFQSCAHESVNISPNGNNYIYTMYDISIKEKYIIEFQEYVFSNRAAESIE